VFLLASTLVVISAVKPDFNFIPFMCHD
jgi:hypothetical protein